VTAAPGQEEQADAYRLEEGLRSSQLSFVAEALAGGWSDWTDARGAHPSQPAYSITITPLGVNGPRRAGPLKRPSRFPP
jgi:hypothetical protein